MSFSNAPDEPTLGRAAGALAVDEAFVEKDWFVVEAIRVLASVGNEDIAPVFSGGTSLLKGYALIKRFSEDIDFKLTFSESFVGTSGNQRRKALRRFHDLLITKWRSRGFDIISADARDGNGFLRVEMGFPSVLEPHASLRPHVLAELSAKPPRMPVQHRPIASFVAQHALARPEVRTIACVDPVETTADKLSAFAWRMLARVRHSETDDPTIVRHLHDLAALEPVAAASPTFPELLRSVVESDSGRGGMHQINPNERLAAMCTRLADDRLYADEYSRFVEGMAFGRASEVPSFEAAVAALIRLCARLQD